jgi:hypothetical protein
VAELKVIRSASLSKVTHKALSVIMAVDGSHVATVLTISSGL